MSGVRIAVGREDLAQGEEGRPKSATAVRVRQKGTNRFTYLSVKQMS